MENVSLLTQINSLPANLRQEVQDFVEFLKTKVERNSEKIEESKAPRKPGALKGKIKMSPDFDEPLDDFKEYM
jgi:hypothetical protein